MKIIPRCKGLLLAVGVGIALAGPALAALECKPRVRAVGQDVLKAVATSLATAAWPARVTAQHGVKFANWSNATDKSTSCELVTGAVGVNVWQCTVRAKPCILN